MILIVALSACWVFVPSLIEVKNMNIILLQSLPKTSLNHYQIILSNNILCRIKPYLKKQLSQFNFHIPNQAFIEIILNCQNWIVLTVARNEQNIIVLVMEESGDVMAFVIFFKLWYFYRVEFLLEVLRVQDEE